MHLGSNLCQRLHELVGVSPVSVESESIDEQSRGSVDTAADSTAKVVADFFRVRARCNLTRDSLPVDTYLGGVHREVVVLQSILILEQEIVHLPESSLC